MINLFQRLFRHLVNQDELINKLSRTDLMMKSASAAHRLVEEAKVRAKVLEQSMRDKGINESTVSSTVQSTVIQPTNTLLSKLTNTKQQLTTAARSDWNSFASKFEKK